MASSTIDHDRGIVEISAVAGDARYVKGTRFYVVGGLAHAVAIEREIRRASMTFAAWQSRLMMPASANPHVGPDPARLEEAQRMGLVHESLLEPPGELAA